MEGRKIGRIYGTTDKIVQIINFWILLDSAILFLEIYFTKKIKKEQRFRYSDMWHSNYGSEIKIKFY